MIPPPSMRPPPSPHRRDCGSRAWRTSLPHSSSPTRARASSGRRRGSSGLRWHSMMRCGPGAAVTASARRAPQTPGLAGVSIEPLRRGWANPRRGCRCGHRCCGRWFAAHRGTRRVGHDDPSGCRVEQMMGGRPERHHVGPTQSFSHAQRSRHTTASAPTVSRVRGPSLCPPGCGDECHGTRNTARPAASTRTRTMPAGTGRHRNHDARARIDPPASRRQSPRSVGKNPPVHILATIPTMVRPAMARSVPSGGPAPMRLIGEPTIHSVEGPS